MIDDNTTGVTPDVTLPLPVTPPVDEAKVAEITAGLVGWRQTLPAKPAELTKLVSYIPTQDGKIKEVRRTPFGAVIADATVVLAPASPPIANGVYLSVPRLPWELFAQAVAFFRKVNEEHRSEALVQFFTKAEAGEAGLSWFAHVPEQEVSGGSVHHESEFDKDSQYTHLLDIHSHNTMGAFWSGTDDTDERRAVRLYGVVGKITQPVPASRWRCWTGTQFLALKVFDVVQPPTVATPINVSTSSLFEAEDGHEKTTLQVTTEIDPFEGVTFPTEWLTQLKQPQAHGSYSRGTWKWDKQSMEWKSDEETWCDHDWNTHERVAGFRGHRTGATTTLPGGGLLSQHTGKIYLGNMTFLTRQDYDAYINAPRPRSAEPTGPSGATPALASDADDPRNLRIKGKRMYVAGGICHPGDTIFYHDLKDIEERTKLLYIVKADGKVYRWEPAKRGWKVTGMSPTAAFIQRRTHGRMLVAVHPDAAWREADTPTDLTH